MRGPASVLVSALALLAGTAPPPPAHPGRLEAAHSSPSTAPRQAPRAMTVQDVVEVRQATETQMSPDGRRVAVVVSEPSVASDAVTSRVVVLDSATGLDDSTVTAETSSTSRITNLRWSPDGRSIRFLSARGGADEMWSVPLAGGRARQLFDSGSEPAPVGGWATPFESAVVPPHLAKVLAFETSPDGHVVAYTTPYRKVRADPSEGVAYDDRVMTGAMIQRGNYDVYDVRLWLRDLGTGRTRLVADLPIGINSLAVGGLAWSPDGSRLALIRLASRAVAKGGFELALGVVDRAGGELRTVPTEDLLPYRPVWSPDGSSILGQHGRVLVGIPLAGGEAKPVVTLPDDSAGVEQVWWSADGGTVAAAVYGLSRSLYAGERSGVLTPVVAGSEDLSECAFDAGLRRAVCAGQSAGSPLRLVVVDVAAHTVRPGAALNPQLRDVAVIEPEPKRWTNRYGSTATGYRIVPPQCRTGGTCPVVVITHGSDARNRFMWAGQEWNYPSQVFAARGVVVLLVNEARYSVPGVAWEEQRLRLGLDAVAIMEAAVYDAAAAGYADAARAGIMGYSHGFQTGALAIAHTTTFRAASLANGGDGPTTYWSAGRKDLRDYWALRYGGSPVGRESGPRWRELDPAQNADRIDSALLMQFDDYSTGPALELYSYLRDRHRPVELRIFPGENHLFYLPRHRAAAMNQNLAWFDQWLR